MRIAAGEIEESMASVSNRAMAGIKGTTARAVKLRNRSPDERSDIRERKGVTPIPGCRSDVLRQVI
jgi:hypothetical protein